MKKIFVITAVSLSSNDRAQVMSQDNPPAQPSPSVPTLNPKALIQNIPYSSKLGCGLCVAGGYSYCWKTQQEEEILSDSQYFARTNPLDSICCQSFTDTTNCPQAIDPTYVCSGSYASTSYSLHVCPFQRSVCGPINQVNFYSAGVQGAIAVQNMAVGQACTYTINNVCGSPSFKVGNNSNMYIFYSEWQQQSVAKSAPVQNQAPNSALVLQSSPIQGYPSRSVVFTNSAQNTNQGNPVFGLYSKIGWKSWGNTVQDGSQNSQIGRRYASSDNSCLMRNMLITVVSNNTNARLLAEVSSVTFYAANLKSFFAFSILSIILLFQF